MACARIAGVLLDEFNPYIQYVMPPLMAALQVDTSISMIDNTEGLIASQDDNSSTAAATAAQQQPGVATISYSVRGLGPQMFTVNTAAMQTAKVACQVLYEYTECLGVHMAPFAHTVLLKVLPNLSKCNTPSVRIVTAAIVPKLLELTLQAAATPGNESLYNEAQAMLNELMPPLIIAMNAAGQDLDNEELIEAMCVAADGLSSCLKLAYESKDTDSSSTISARIAVVDTAIEPLIEAFRAGIIASLEREAARTAIAATATSSDDVDDETIEDIDAKAIELEEWEDDILTSCGDAIGWLIKARGAQFLPLFEARALPVVSALLTTGRRDSQRSLALCMCIDVVSNTALK
jgi:mannose/fructose/N-acetylgalactosamine-specific phosphotransferase system component IID